MQRGDCRPRTRDSLTAQIDKPRRSLAIWQEWLAWFIAAFRVLKQRRVGLDNSCLAEIIFSLGLLYRSQHGDMQVLHCLALEAVEEDWVAGLKHILSGVRQGLFLDGDASLADFCGTILQTGAVHIAAAGCNAEMLAFLLKPDSSDPLLNEMLRAPAAKALCQVLSSVSPPEELRSHTLDETGRYGQFPPLALALAYEGWMKPGAGSDALLQTLTVLVEGRGGRGTTVDGTWKMWKTRSYEGVHSMVKWEDLVYQAGHKRAVCELLIKASSRSGAAVKTWLERSERDEETGELIAGLVSTEGKQMHATRLGLCNSVRAVEQLVVSDTSPKHRAKLNELALELAHGRDDELAPNRIELLCLLLQKRLVLLEEHTSGISLGSQLLFAAASANAAATVPCSAVYALLLLLRMHCCPCTSPHVVP